jgi:hypothetical protein
MMGTNYYYFDKLPSHCDKIDEAIHIGKSSYGWCFSLHVSPEDGIIDLLDWKKLFQIEDSFIQDEYGRKIHIKEMESIISERISDMAWDVRVWDIPPILYKSEAEFHRINKSMRGPNNLARRIIDSRCIKHGEGTWDCMVGDFS